MNPFAKYSLYGIPRAPEGGGGSGAGAGAGAGAAASGSGAGNAGAAGAGAAGSGASAGAGAGGAAAGVGGGASAGAGADKGPWYTLPDYGFDDDTRKFFEGKNYPDAKTALSSLRHADQVARDRNVLSKPDPAKLNEWDGWESLGWKKDPKDYAIAKPELQQGQKLDEALFASFAKDAHELRIPLSTAQELFSRQFKAAYERIGALDADGAAARKALDTQLRSDWGPNYDVRFDRSKRAARALGVGMDDSAELERLVGSPRLVKLFDKFGEMLGEDALVTANSGGSQETAHPATIEAELTRFEQDPGNLAIMKNERDPRYSEVTAQRRKLINRLAASRQQQRP